MSAAEPCPPGTEFLDAETGPSKSPPETTYAPQRPKGPETGSADPGTNGLSELDGKIHGSQGLGGGGASLTKPVSVGVSGFLRAIRRISG